MLAIRLFPACRLAIALLGSLLASLAVAQQSLSTNLSASPADFLDARAQLEQKVNNYRQEIEQRSGVYDQLAIELYTSLGDALMQLGNYDEASAVYSESLQGARINDGLYGESQLAILDSYTVSALAEKDWAQVDRNFYLSLDVAAQTIAPDSPQFESLVRRFTNWKIEVHRNDLDIENNPRSIEDTIEYYEVLIDALPEDELGYTNKLITYMTEKGLAHYHAAMAISDLPFEEFAGQGTQTINTQSCYTINDSSGKPVRVCDTVKTANPDYFESRQRAKFSTLETHISAIRGGFIELIATLEQEDDVDPVTLVTAVMALGDMNYLLQDELRAKSQYRKAHDILMAADVADAVYEELMGQPKEIGRGALTSAGLEPVAAAQTPSGLVSFEVTADGKIRNLGITGSGADLEQENQALITRRLRQSVYRPGLDDGVPVNARVERLPAAQL